MAKKAETAPAAGKAARKKQTAGAPKKSARKAGASTSPITADSNAARMVGDQLRGIAYLAKKLALAIEEKQLRVRIDPKEVKELSDRAYSLALDLRLDGDDGSNGG